MGDVEYRCVGVTQSGITISTCRDLRLVESPIEPRFGDGKPERLGWRLDSIVEERDELQRDHNLARQLERALTAIDATKRNFEQVTLGQIGWASWPNGSTGKAG
jgi:hypothetical protein